MNSRANLLIDGPFALLRQLVSLYKKGSGPDSRAQVTIHSKSGKIWTGVPVSFSEDKSRSFLVLEVQPKK